MDSNNGQEYRDYLKILTQEEIDERLKYILGFVKRGASRNKTQAKFRERFGYGERQTRSWYVRAVDSLMIADEGEQPRMRAVILEMLHKQIVAFHQDLEKFNDIISNIEADNDLRNVIKKQLSIVTDDRQLESLNQELESIPSHSIEVLLEAIECRSKTRERIAKACHEISRLHGLFSIETAIVDAKKKVSSTLEQS
jgi:hypothetical protein